MQTFLLEITGYDSDLAAERVLRYSSVGYQTQPGDTPANTFYEPRLEIPFNLQQSVLDDGYSGGGGSGGFGESVLRNDDDLISFISDLGLDGRSAKLLVGDTESPYSTFTTLFSGTMTGVEFTWDTVVIKLKDKSTLLDVDIQTTKYLGNNSLPSGVEGTADDLKDQQKPLCYGECLNITPSWVNTSKMIFQVHDGAIEDVVNVYGNGVALIKGADYPVLADFYSNSPAGGTFYTCKAYGLFRLGPYFDGAITADVKGDKTGGTYVYKAADIVKRVVNTRTVVTSAEVDAISLSAANTAVPYTVGFYVEAGSTDSVFDSLSSFLEGLGVFWFWKRDGKMYFGNFSLPLTSPLTTMTEDDLIDMDRLPPHDLEGGNPAYSAEVEYARNYTVQTKSDLAGYAVQIGRLTFTADEYRKSTSTDASVQTKHKLASALSCKTPIVLKADADTHSAARLAVYKTHLARYSFKTHLDSPCLQGLSTPPLVGDVVEIQLNRFGLSGGKNFLIVSTVEDYQDRTIEYEVLG